MPYKLETFYLENIKLSNKAYTLYSQPIIYALLASTQAIVYTPQLNRAYQVYNKDRKFQLSNKTVMSMF